MSAVPTAVCCRNVCVARHEWATQKYDPKAVTNGLGIFVMQNCRVCHRNICVAFRPGLHKTSGCKSPSSEDLSARSSERNFAWAIRAGPRKNGGSKWMPALPAAANENRLCRSAAVCCRNVCVARHEWATQKIRSQGRHEWPWDLCNAKLQGLPP